MHETAIMWFRRDLRLTDNAALLDACAEARCVVPAYVVPPAGAPEAPGASRRAWLAASLRSLDASLRARGSRLVVCEGSASEALVRLAAECGASLVVCSREWTPAGMAAEAHASDALAASGVKLAVREGALVVTPDALRTRAGGGYRVFTPFHRSWLERVRPESPQPAPEHISPPERWPSGADLPEKPSAAPDIGAYWEPGESDAARRLKRFVRDNLARYPDTHDRMDLRGTSELSPYLANGEISARQVLHAVDAALVGQPERSAARVAADAFVRQIAWRDFAYHVLADAPTLPALPLRPEFAAMPWQDDPAGFDAWRAGLTGYPVVDAGMRQLAETGWMHNRARMVVGSFLAKDLLVGWQAGQRHFSDLLADADTAANAFNWQWVAGSGADASPYFRVFNPVLQGTKFDPDGAYVRLWVPELAGLPVRWIHAPHQAPADVLRTAGVRLGATYPRPVVDHAEARERALAAYDVVKAAKG